jgi:hypothetical protein
VSDIRMAEFQQAAVSAICERLIARKGPRRFLLADEVGLGKTIVARGVLEEWQRRRRGRDLVVVYLCSNAEIADQNRTKLDPDSGAAIRRITQLAYRGGKREGLLLYSFTPGTSLSEGTGLKWERQLLLYLVYRVLRQDIRKSNWREYFRCGARAEYWFPETTLRALRSEFHRKLDPQLWSRVAEEWRRPVDLDGETFVPASDLSTEIAAHSPATSRRRNGVIGILRQGVQRVILDQLKPHLVVLDEVQRFREVLEDGSKKKSIAARLFDRGAAVLILSATPYRMLSLDHESHEQADGRRGPSHYDEFIDTVKFLYADRGETVVSALRGDLEAFRRRLESGDFVRGHDEQLHTLKSRIERVLRGVIARTERNWYLQEHGKGVEEVFPAGDERARPRREELIDYVSLRRFLLDKVETSQHITEYWKSCPAPFTFMDGQYAPMAATRRQRQPLPEGLVARPQQLGAIARRSLRFRELFRTIFGEEHQQWRFLWTRPSYTYYEDAFYRDDDPRKMLVFSSWRFVPKAIALLTSHAAEQRVAAGGRLWEGDDRPPLRFTERGSFFIFDVCFPSPALASVLEPSAFAVRGWTSKQLLAETRRRLLRLFQEAGVHVGDTSGSSVWQAVAALDGRKGNVAEALQVSRAFKGGEVTERFRDHADEYVDWMRSSSSLRISWERLNHIAEIAAFSPAVALLRAAWTVYPDTKGRVPEEWMDLCIESLRSYFNRRVVRAVIDRNTGRSRGYARSVLEYCQRAHLQAVADEHLYLVRHVLQQLTPKEAATHLGRVFGIGLGTPTMNLTSDTRRLKDKPYPRRAHFALAFADDVTADQRGRAEQSTKSRKTSIREAFNSPFWPFVLSTTSVGQEGLDFHLYCRDIVHWNLPSNPVDLEQREGRINRRDGLAIRRSVAREWPPARIEHARAGPEENIWARAFGAVEAASGVHTKHGLHPHWVFDGSQGNAECLRRHLFFYAESNDAARYHELKERLALYRLVFGQPRQQDLLDRIQRSLTTERDLPGQHAALTRYMINLSPLEGRHAAERARLEAEQLVTAPNRLKLLLREVAEIQRTRGTELSEVATDLTLLVALVQGHINGSPVPLSKLKTAVSALAYLRDPFDALYDQHRHFGLEDDARRIRLAAISVAKNSRRP